MKDTTLLALAVGGVLLAVYLARRDKPPGTVRRVSPDTARTWEPVPGEPVTVVPREPVVPIP